MVHVSHKGVRHLRKAEKDVAWPVLFGNGTAMHATEAEDDGDIVRSFFPTAKNEPSTLVSLCK